jgi:hypothetical protein
MGLEMVQTENRKERGGEERRNLDTSRWWKRGKKKKEKEKGKRQGE